MRYFLLTLLLIFTNNLFSQIILIKDSLLNSPIENANLIFNSKGMTSDKNGKVDISFFNNDDIIEISHIAYYLKKIKKTSIDSIVYLQQKSNMLPTIILTEDIKIPLSKKHNLFTINPVGFSLLLSSTSELLSSNSSVVVQESQSGGGSPNYRGMEANRLLLIVDGIPLNNTIYRSGHLQSSATINPFFIESIKLISGPASVSYGNGAMGGALLFNTKQTINKTSFLSRQQFESSSSSVINNFQATYYKKKFFHITAFSLKSAKNLTMGSNRIHDYEDWGNERIATNKNEQLYTGYTQGDFMHKTKYAITKKSSLLFNTQYSRSSKIYRFDKMNDIKNDTAKYKHWYYGPQIRFFQSIDYTTKYKTIAFEKIKTTLSFQNLQESRHKQLIEDTLLNNRKENVRVFDFNLDLSKKNHAIDFSYGLGVRAQKVVSKASLTNNSDIFYNTTRYPDNGSEVQDFFTYSQMGLTLNKKTDLLIGLRFNHSNLNANFNNFIFQEINNKNNSFVKSLILFYKPIKSTVLNASYYSGFRNPNIDDIGKLFSKDGLNVVVPNADLKPEYVNNFELSFNYILNPLKIQVQIFNSHITNAINREYGLFNGSDSILYDGEIMRVQMNKNITQANINGVHFSIDFNANDYLLMQGSCNYLSGLKNDSIPLSHIPPLNAKFSIDYKIRNHTFNFYTNYNSWKNIEDYDDLGVDNIGEATEDGNPSWYTLNLGYSRKIDKNISFSCCIKNLLNVHYKTFASGISASGRNFVLSIDSTF